MCVCVYWFFSFQSGGIIYLFFFGGSGGGGGVCGSVLISVFFFYYYYFFWLCWFLFWEKPTVVVSIDGRDYQRRTKRKQKKNARDERKKRTRQRHAPKRANKLKANTHTHTLVPLAWLNYQVDSRSFVRSSCSSSSCFRRSFVSFSRLMESFLFGWRRGRGSETATTTKSNGPSQWNPTEGDHSTSVSVCQCVSKCVWDSYLSVCVCVCLCVSVCVCVCLCVCDHCQAMRGVPWTRLAHCFDISYGKRKASLAI